MKKGRTNRNCRQLTFKFGEEIVNRYLACLNDFRSPRQDKLYLSILKESENQITEQLSVAFEESQRSKSTRIKVLKGEGGDTFLKTHSRWLNITCR